MAETFKTYVSASGKLLEIVTDMENVREISFVEERGHTARSPLSRLRGREAPADKAEEDIPSKSGGHPHAKVPPILEKAAVQLEEYLLGKRENFDLNLSPQGTDFQKKVWQLLQKIPFGKTLTYARIATLLGDPRVIRAAASANGKNPIAIVIPCHRVIGSDGSLTGYAGGLENKRFLLELERANGVLTLFS